MWKKYNGRIIAVCAVIFMLGMTGFFAGHGTECEGTQEEQQSDMAAEQEQQTPAPVVMKPDAAKPEHDFAPASYDLSEIPDMENRMYAVWEGNIYYRQYSDEDKEDGGLWADFEPVPDTVKEIMCMKPDGSVTQVGVDYGWGAFYIVNGRIYSQKVTKSDDGDHEVAQGIVYSCALDGSDVKEYDACKVLDVRGDRIVCATDGNGIAWIDGRDGQEHILIAENKMQEWVGYLKKYLDATEEEVFFSQITENGSEGYAPYDLTLCSVDYQGEIEELATVTEQEYVDCLTDDLMQYPLYIPCFQIREDELYFSVGSANGNAYMYSGGMIYRVKRDGNGLVRLVDFSPAKRFYLYDDGENSVLYYKSSWGSDDMQQMVLQGKAVDAIMLRDADQTFYDKPWGYRCDGADEILFYPDASGVCYVLLTREESEELGIRTHVDGHTVQQIEDIEYLNRRLFFTVTDLSYSEEYSQGWRDGYERGRSVCYCKDMESGEIRRLYEY